MKKYCLFKIFLFLMILSCNVEAACNVNQSPYDVKLNGHSFVKSTNYPILIYNNITYLPMTYHAGKMIQRSIEWIDGYEQDILLLEEMETKNIIIENDLSKNEAKLQTVKAEFADCTVAIRNGECLNLISSTDQYPLLRYKDIIYIPLTWENIVEKFGWEYAFDEINGVCIDTSQNNIEAKLEKDVYISEDGSTTCYLLEKNSYIDENGYEKFKWIGLIRFNHDMTTKVLPDGFIIERELSQPIKQGDLRIFKTYHNKDFYAPNIKERWTFLHSATTMMLDTRTGSINKWQSLASRRKSEVKDESTDESFLSMSATDYVSDSITIINIEDVDIELKSIPMQYVIKRVDEGKEEVLLTYDVPEFSGGSLIVPAPTSTITKVHISLPPWDFRDSNGAYVPEGEYEVSLVVPDTVEYIASGKRIVLENPKGVFINSRIKLVK